jgi:hypothetical protein
VRNNDRKQPMHGGKGDPAGSFCGRHCHGCRSVCCSCLAICIPFFTKRPRFQQPGSASCQLSQPLLAGNARCLTAWMDTILDGQWKVLIHQQITGGSVAPSTAQSGLHLLAPCQSCFILQLPSLTKMPISALPESSLNHP